MSPTSVCEGLDVICKVNVNALSILHFLENDPNEPHGNKVVPVTEVQEQEVKNEELFICGRFDNSLWMADSFKKKWYAMETQTTPAVTGLFFEYVFPHFFCS